MGLSLLSYYSIRNKCVKYAKQKLPEAVVEEEKKKTTHFEEKSQVRWKGMRTEES